MGTLFHHRLDGRPILVTLASTAAEQHEMACAAPTIQRAISSPNPLAPPEIRYERSGRNAAACQAGGKRSHSAAFCMFRTILPRYARHPSHEFQLGLGELLGDAGELGDFGGGRNSCRRSNKPRPLRSSPLGASQVFGRESINIDDEVGEMFSPKVAPDSVCCCDRCRPCQSRRTGRTGRGTSDSGR